jgi:hypothetical protein
MPMFWAAEPQRIGTSVPAFIAFFRPETTSSSESSPVPEVLLEQRVVRRGDVLDELLARLARPRR